MYADALEEMLKTISFEKIRVKDLCETCDADRQNFYYHFKAKYALAAWIFEQDYLMSADQCGEQFSVELLTTVMQK